jgi:flagellar hook-length control protein FliK
MLTTQISVPSLGEALVTQALAGVEAAVRASPASIRLQLQPENLGRIDLRVRRSGGSLAVSLQAELPETQALLQQHLPELRQSLDQARLPVNQVSIGLELSQQHAGGQPSPSDHGGRQPAAHPHAASPSAEPAGPGEGRRSNPRRRAGGPGSVDVRV